MKLFNLGTAKKCLAILNNVKHKQFQPISSLHLTSQLAYEVHHPRSINDPESYWGEAAEQLVWNKKWDRVLDTSNLPYTKWFPGGELSHCYNCLDRHVENGRGDQVAIIHDSPVTNSITKITYKELTEQVSYMAGALSELGVTKGDRVMVYMPMIPQAVISMLAAVRLGAIHVVIFGGFAAKELSVRIDNCKPKVILSTNCGIEPSRVINYKPILEEAIGLSTYKPAKTVVFQRPNMEKANLRKDVDMDWNDALGRQRPHDCVPVEANHPLYLLYTSGTTGTPKAVVRPTGGHSVRLHWSMKAIYDVDPGEVYWAAADLGWAVGHSYGAHAPLIYGATSVIYEGKPVGTPDPSSFYRVISEHNVACFFAAPTAIRSIKREDPTAENRKKYDLSCLKNVFVAGEHCDSDTFNWCKTAFQVPVFDHWWQSETGSAITSSCVGLGNRLNPPEGSSGLAVPGWDMRVVDDDGNELPRGKLGNLVAKLPLPPGAFQTLWNDKERFKNTYFVKYKGYYDTMDAGVMDEEGYISVMSRTDDVINVAGHRLSCGHIEEVINQHDCVIECAVVAKDDALKGSVAFGFVVLKPNIPECKDPKIMLSELVKLVRQEIGPVAAFKDVVFVSRLPKTRSGKTPRNSLQALCNGKPYKISPTIEDATVYTELETSMAAYNK